MKKFLILLFTAVTAFGVDAANDVVLSQRNAGNTGFIQRNVPAQNAITSGSLPSFLDAIGLGATDAPTFLATNLTGSSGITGLGVVNSGSITSGFGSIDVGADPITGGVMTGTTGTFNGNGGALTAGPTGTVVHVAGADSASARTTVDAFAGTANFVGRRANTSNAAKSAVLSGNIISVFSAFGYRATAYSTGAGGFIGFSAAENWTDTAIGTNATVTLCPIGSTAQTTVFTFSSEGVFTSNTIVGGVQALSGAGAVDVANAHTDFTSTGGAQALTLANGTLGQTKTICHTVDGGSGVLTPTTKIGFTTITFTNVGDSVTLRYTATGWAIVGIFGAVAA